MRAGRIVAEIVTHGHTVITRKVLVLPGVPTLTRVHAFSALDDMLGRSGPRKRTLQRSMVEIGRVGSGVIIILFPPRDLDMHWTDVEIPEMDLRGYGIGAQILADLGVHDMILLTNARRNLVAIEGYGLNVVGEKSISEE